MQMGLGQPDARWRRCANGPCGKTSSSWLDAQLLQADDLGLRLTQPRQKPLETAARLLTLNVAIFIGRWIRVRSGTSGILLV